MFSLSSQLLLLPFIPESPAYLFGKPAAIASLVRARWAIWRDPGRLCVDVATVHESEDAAREALQMLKVCRSR